jgi:hypothetical protein
MSNMDEILQVEEHFGEPLVELDSETERERDVRSNKSPPQLTEEQLRNIDLRPSTLRRMLEDLRAAYL